MNIEKLSNLQIVTIAVALLKGHINHVDREDIAIKANKIAPGKFNWRKYPNRIDLDVVRVSLNDAKKLNNGALLIGNNTRGWMLSPNALKWFQYLKKSDQLRNGLFEQAVEKIFSDQMIEQERLFNTNAYQLFKNNRQEEINGADFAEFSRLDEYFKEKARERRFAVIDNAVFNNRDLSELWVILKSKFLQEG